MNKGTIITENKILKKENEHLRFELKVLQECCRSYRQALINEVEKRSIDGYRRFLDNKKASKN